MTMENQLLKMIKGLENEVRLNNQRVRQLSAIASGDQNHFMAYRSSSQSSLSTGWNKVQLDAEDYDPESKFDSTTNHRYTVPVSGYYNIHLGCRVVNASGASRHVSGGVYVTGTDRLRFFEHNFSGDGNMTATGSFRAYLEKDDYLELYFYTDNASGVSIWGHSTVRATFMGASRDTGF